MHVWTKPTFVPFQLEVDDINDDCNVLKGVNGKPIQVLVPNRVWYDFQPIMTLTGNIAYLGYRTEDKIKIFFSAFLKLQRTWYVSVIQHCFNFGIYVQP